MGQRAIVRVDRRPRPRTPTISDAAAGLCVFATDLGWFGLLGSGDTVARLSIGHLSADDVRCVFATAATTATDTQNGPPIQECDWNPQLRRALQDFARGIPTTFEDVNVEVKGAPEFFQRVWTLTRKIGYGHTVTYGELAARAGNPRGARAVGAAMGANRIPLIIPCHRVVASGGKLGGFSAPRGADFKRQLLQMEAETRWHA